MSSQKRWWLLLFIFLLLLLGLASFWILVKPLEKKNKSGLQVVTKPGESSIFLNGEFLGQTPFLTKDLKPGQYQIRLEPSDQKLAAYEATLNLRKGLLTVMTWKTGETLLQSGGVIYELEKLKYKGTELAITSIPDGAIISLDNSEKEFTPVSKNQVAAGKHEIIVSLPSYEGQQHQINVVPGHRLNVLFKLAKAEEAEENTAVLGTNTEEVVAGLAPSPSSLVFIKNTNYFENGLEVLKARSASSSAATILGTAKVGEKYPFAGEETLSWIKIKLTPDQPAWINKDYAQISN